MSEILNIFGDCMKRKRASKGMSQEGLAKALGVSRVSVASYEGGRQSPTLEVALNIADELDFSLDALKQMRREKISPKFQGLVAAKSPDTEAATGMMAAIADLKNGLTDR